MARRQPTQQELLEAAALALAEVLELRHQELEPWQADKERIRRLRQRVRELEEGSSTSGALRRTGRRVRQQTRRNRG